jgi:hypothetical protein
MLEEAAKAAAVVELIWRAVKSLGSIGSREGSVVTAEAGL